MKPKEKTMMTSRDIVLNLLKGEKTPCPPVMPVTMMFATDVIGKPYRDYARDYHVLVDAQIETARRFGFNHVSAISDPAREAADFGSSIAYFDDQPPAVDESNALLADKSKLNGLMLPDPVGGGRMHDRIKAISSFKEKVGTEFLIEGWVEGPCAEAADLRGINSIMFDFFDDRAFITDLFDLVLENAINFARHQIDAGADIIGIGDAAVSLLGPQIYDEVIFQYEKKLIDAIHEMGGLTRLHICGNITDIIGGMGKTGADIIDVDSAVSMAHAREQTGERQVLLGNINPVAVLRDGTPEIIRAELQKCRDAAGQNYIVGAGCEIPRDTARENVEALAEFARSCQ